METVVLINAQGMRVELIPWGARIKSIKVPLRGVLTEMVLGYENAEDYLNDNCYLGAICGRVCGRIADGHLNIDGAIFKLDQNEHEHCHHGGYGNMAKQYWDIDGNSTPTFVKFRYFSDDKSQGFPGNVNLSVEYTLTDDNCLHIVLAAVSDQKTPINLTNHTYFNLGEDNINDLLLMVNAEQFLEQSNSGIPTGNLVDVMEVGHNLRLPITIKQLLSDINYTQMAQEQALDHCFVVDSTPFNTPKIEISSSKNGVKVSILSDQPAALIYTGKYLESPLKPFQGICVECQGYTDAVNHAHFPSIMMSPNERYCKKIIYQFSAI